MEPSVESDSFEKFEAIAPLPVLFAHISDILKKRRFLRKSSKPGHGSLFAEQSNNCLYLIKQTLCQSLAVISGMSYIKVTDKGVIKLIKL